MAKNITLESTEFAILHYARPNENDHESNPAPLAVHDELYLKFQQPTDGTEFKKIYREHGAGIYPPQFGISASLGRTSYSSDKTEKAIRVGLLPREFDPQSITYATKQADELLGYIDMDNASMAQHGSVWVTLFDAAKLIDAVKTGVAMAVADSDQPAGYQFKTIGTGRGEIGLTIDETTTCGLVVTPLSPLSGSAPAQADNTFTWEITDHGECLAELKPTAVTFGWRDTDGSAMQQIPLSADARSVTIPAGRFAGHTEIEWWVTVTANSGEETISDGVTLSTADVRSKAVVISPMGTIVDSAKDMIFRWRHIIETKTPQNGALLQKSEDGIDWETLVEMIGRDQDWLFSAGTLDNKIKYWRVATRNSDDVLGEWSDPARITVIAAPDAPELSASSNSPRPRIEWFAPDQAAYQVLVTDISGVPETNYGADNMWQCPYYLSDGDHVVRVRVQNQYGLWSKWAQITVNVVNTPGADITLEVGNGNVATLRWQSDGNYDFYLIYRGDKIIDKVYGSESVEYIDKFAYGTTRYQVRGCYYDSSNYGLSNISTANVTTGQYAMLYDAQYNGADYPSVELRHCGLRKQPLQTATSYDIQYYFMYGSQYPHAERSEFVTKKIGGTVVFLPDEETEKDLFMSMAGTLVCLKTQTGEMVIGYLNDVSETALPNPSKSVINFSIQQIDFTEVVDIDA